jgi:hypothetical protein
MDEQPTFRPRGMLTSAVTASHLERRRSGYAAGQYEAVTSTNHKCHYRRIAPQLSKTAEYTDRLAKKTPTLPILPFTEVEVVARLVRSGEPSNEETPECC